MNRRARRRHLQERIDLSWSRAQIVGMVGGSIKPDGKLNRLTRKRIRRLPPIDPNRPAVWTVHRFTYQEDRP